MASKLKTRLDHIVVAASSLQEGADYIQQTLGVAVPDGGEHEMMATHNKVMTLQNNVYFEIIAINPNMSAPDYPRWFGLDDPHIRQSISNHPRLLTWAVNTVDLSSLVNLSRVNLGVIKDAQRGNLKWRVTLSEDGRLPGAGFIPLCIQWKMETHPSLSMADLGCVFNGLTLYHPRSEWLKVALTSIDADCLVQIEQIKDSEPAYMIADFNCPKGRVQLSNRLD